MPSFESGNFKLEYAGTFPDQLKLIKTFEVFPLEITAIGSLNPRNHKWSYSVGCRVSDMLFTQYQYNVKPLLHSHCMPGCRQQCMYTVLLMHMPSTNILHAARQPIVALYETLPGHRCTVRNFAGIAGRDTKWQDNIQCGTVSSRVQVRCWLTAVAGMFCPMLTPMHALV
jgi:hypothetical protein